ncbi:RNA polymerase sigma factor [Alkalihalobacillus sp. LMS6]|uniref:RNA polymerase sigma factor n=1 Tax=Alkalihalobacillus sp. LMS6 TaxID=2924034 RepID=UPI0020D0CFB7|nr:RNA polymerase sigma factor [Alkalihalobacillus sp. LMS6]UTR05842.1 RNA polymerase sigma factor [Alkalihalobacillus sp. LMS6]
MFEIHHQLLEQDIRRFALSIAANVHEASDLMQYAWEKSLHVMDLSDWPYHKQKAWFYRVMKNQLIDIRRKDKRHVLLSKTEEPVFSPTEIHTFEMMDLLDDLSPTQKDIVFKRYWLGFTSSEIGKELEIPASTVRYQLTKAVQRLRDLLKEE